MDSSKAKRREGCPPGRQNVAHGTDKKQEADFRRKGGDPVKKLLLE